MENDDELNVLNQAPTDRQWEEAKPEIIRLYATKTLHDTMEVMKERGFVAR